MLLLNKTLFTCRMLLRDTSILILPNVRCYARYTFYSETSIDFILISAVTHCCVCVSHMSLKDLYLLIYFRFRRCFGYVSVLLLVSVVVGECW